MKDILWFEELDRSSLAEAGGKGANLGEMMKAGFPIPPGFVTTSGAYFKFLDHNSLRDEITGILEPLDVDDTAALQEAAEKIQEMIVGGEVPPEMDGEIRQAYQKMCDMRDEKEVYVAVRSSATAEDLPDASFAGQQSTFLNVHGKDGVVKAVKECWASLFTARAIFYRVQNNFDHMKVGLAAVVQEMVQSEKAGVLFTVNPVSQKKDEIMVEAAYGLGEVVVSGSVTPDTYIVDKNSFKIKSREIAKQTWMIMKHKGENAKAEIKDDKQAQQKIPDDVVIELAKIGAKIEGHYGFPQDIEWAYAKDELFIVQSRPVTTLSEEKEEASPAEEAEEEKKGEKAKVILKGLGSSPGYGAGKVNVLGSAKDIPRMEKGAILVTDMTTPDFVPAMKKAAAIVTNTGGMTCFEGNTNVLTDRGFMTMEEVFHAFEDGEELRIFSYDYSGRKTAWKKIIAAGRRRSAVIRASVSQTGNGTLDYIDLTADHKMYTFKDRKLVKKKILDILKEDESVCVVEEVPALCENLLTEHKLGYVAGAILTDGYVSLNRRRGSVTLTQKHTPEKSGFINTVRSYFSEVFDEEMAYTREKHTTSCLEGRQITGCASDFICFKKEPAAILSDLFSNMETWVLSADEETLLSFLGGVVDGDGSFHNNRIQIYIGKEQLLRSVVLASLRLGIVPQVTRNRSIYNVQIVERLGDILGYTNRVKGLSSERSMGTRFFAAKQLLSDIVDGVNYKGRIKPYVEKNLLLDAGKIESHVLPLAGGEHHDELFEAINSGVRMKRVRKMDSLGETYVYNVEVESGEELEKNYVVFTRMYSPLLVSNSHAAIVSRELGIPCVVGTQKATEVLKEGMVVTVDGTHGMIYEGKLALKSEAEAAGQAGTSAQVISQVPVTGTKIYVNLAEVELAEKTSKLPSDGVGLLRAEFMVADMGEHPRRMYDEGREEEFVEALAEGMRRFASAFYPRPVVYRTTDFKTNEYRNLKGGEKYEPEEANPMMGYRGAARYIAEPGVFKMELKAIKKVREEMGLTNLWMMLPFVRRIGELRAIKEMMQEVELYRTKDFQLWIMVEVPSTVLQIDEFCEEGIDGVSIGTNDLTQLVLGIDRDNATLAQGFDERNNAIYRALEQVITTTRKYGVTSSLCGQAPSVYPEFAEKLVQFGITSMSVNPDAVERTRKIVASAEQKVLMRYVREMREGGSTGSCCCNCRGKECCD